MTGAVVLAAGRGTRMGGPKAFLPLPRGPLLAHQLAHLPVEHIALVIPEGPSYLALAGLGDPRVLEPRNQQLDLGPFHSLQLGLAALPLGVDPIFVVPVDCPLDPALPQAMLEALAARPDLTHLVPARPTTTGALQAGHPVLLRGHLRTALLALPPNQRLDQVLALQGGGHLPWEGPLPFLNLNSPEDHQRLLALLAPANPKELP